ncbi:hypothetical protein D3OALGA1CA_4738 [Olavius algarvensis associated proteobacterium Delta 3]|nr:hypothetical protein D3OALGB2SA_2013 [Olavius algarvensis associated proteobacterium Delta 3]CAB5156130.1 hypothetical protein D3OALGA1CA_4738 [Olavius algarvensis associated proteobacterium Delta 3]
MAAGVWTNDWFHFIDMGSLGGGLNWVSAMLGFARTEWDDTNAFCSIARC